MNPRRLSQLERAAKLKASIIVHVSHAELEAPERLELAQVKLEKIQTAQRAYVQAMSWHHPQEEQTVHTVAGPHASEESLAFSIDAALDRFEKRYPW
jgi:hypothetical protein